MSKEYDDYMFFCEKIMPYAPKIKRFIMSIAKDVEITADVVQNTMESAWKFRKSVNQYASIEAGLISIAKHHLHMYYRSHPPTIPLEDISEEKIDGLILEDAMKTVYDQDEIKDLLRKLDDREAKILILRYYHDLSFKHIAKKYRINYNTIVSWHSRILKKLKKEFKSKNR